MKDTQGFLTPNDLMDILGGITVHGVSIRTLISPPNRGIIRPLLIA